MAKVNQEKLLKYKELDKGAFEFENLKVKKFFDRSISEGYSLDTTGFLANPGFFQAPHTKEVNSENDIAFVGCPLDLGAIGLSGARHGPKAMREASRNYGPMNDVTGEIPFEQCNIIDYGDVEWSCTNLDIRVSNDIPEVFEQLSSKGLNTLSCGGEHTTTYGVLKGLSKGFDDSFGLVQLDAHCDTMSIWGGDKINDGSVFRQAVLDGYIDPERTVQIGIRGRANFLWEFSHDTGMTVITADEVFDKGIGYVIDKVKEVTGDGKTYFTLDLDSIDSSYMMGTTGPEPFGLYPRQIRELIHGLRGIDFIGADVVELNPNRDLNGSCALLAAGLMFELLCLLSDTRVLRTGISRKTHWK